ncbi:hypothetical protein D516_0501 [Rhodobacter sp. AKP1]|nr:Hypothetical Protein RSKD131_0404 [Cereibacter sphaeroides KD131]EKX58638.1 hypothetical protein D516_0501 [Rhodobacter sp. AKP1]
MPVPSLGVQLRTHTWGDVCSHARRICHWMKAGACMKPAFRLFGVCRPCSLSRSHLVS